MIRWYLLKEFRTKIHSLVWLSLHLGWRLVRLKRLWTKTPKRPLVKVQTFPLVSKTWFEYHEFTYQVRQVKRVERFSKGGGWMDGAQFSSSNMILFNFMGRPPLKVENLCIKCFRKRPILIKITENSRLKIKYKISTFFGQIWRKFSIFRQIFVEHS